MTTSPTVPEGTVVGEYTVGKLIGAGGYGEIYSVVPAYAPDVRYSMKVELKNAKRKELQTEIEFLESMERTPHLPVCIDFGKDKKKGFSYGVFELLGPSLAAIKRILPEHRFSLAEVCRLGSEMLKCIQTVHGVGYIHSDIKPGNFLLRPNAECPVCLVDFGLVKPYFKADGEHIPLETGVGFIGTCRYASLHAHGGISLSRRDDLISWFYSLVEMAVGKLPWPGGKDKAMTYEVKRSITPQKLCKSLPPEFQEIYSIVVHLEFNSDPDYDALSKLLKDVYDRVTEGKEPRFDWELVSQEEVDAISPIPMTMKAGPLEDLVFPPPKEKKHGSIGSFPGKKKESCIVA